MNRTIRTARLLALPIVALSALTACGDDTADSPGAPITTSPPASTVAPVTTPPADTTPPVPADPPLDGMRFVSTAVEGHVLVDGSQIGVSFDDGQISVGAGCNSAGGSYRVEDGRLIVDGLNSTLMACDQPLMDQDAWFAEMLQSQPAIEVDGATLLMVADAVSITFTDREVADPDRPLEATAWNVDATIDAHGIASVPAGASLTFADGALQFDSGCNGGGGDYELDGSTLTVGPIVHTEMACADDVMQLESTMIAVLGQPLTVEIDAARLRLTATDGTGLSLSAAA